MNRIERKISLRIYLFIYIAILPLIASAQLGTLYTSSQKLSSSYAKHIYQDKLGFIWVSTDDGLNRYDGYSFLTFNSDDGLTSDNVNCTIEDGQQHLYAGTTSGLFVKINGKFHQVKQKNGDEELPAYVNAFIAAPDGSILFSTAGRGIWRIVDVDKAEQLVKGVGKAQFTTDMALDKNSTLWVVSENNGVLVYKLTVKDNVMKLKQTAFYDVAGENFNKGVLCVGNRNEIYVGLLNNGGVYKLEKGSKQFALIPSTANIPVTYLTLLRDGLLYIGTNGIGLKVLNTATYAIEDSKITCRQIDIKKTKVYSIYEDRYNNLWLGLLQKGVFMQPPLSKAFKCIGMNQMTANPIGESCIMAVYRQKNGTLWLSGDQDGVFSFDKDYKLLNHFSPFGGVKNLPATTLTFEEDIKGRLWIGSYTDGCGWIESSNGAYHRMQFSYGNAQSVFDIRSDKKGNMWIGTLGDGLKCYNVNTEKIKEYRKPAKDNGICNDFILQMNLSHDEKKLFIGTATGLSCLDIPTGSWTNTFGTNVVLPGEAISAIKHDGKNILWIGNGKGLYKYDLKSRKIVKTYTREDGLPDSHVCSIEIANNGDLWISTNNGLCRFRPTDETVEKYYASDGLQGNEYCPGASFYDDVRNTVFFAGTSGISYINPSLIKAASRKLSVIITGINVSGVRVKSFMESGSYEICDKAVSEADRFDFCHDDNTLNITFSTLTYSLQDHIAFAYSINGDDWITLPMGQNTLTLSRMSPGDYNIRVVAIDNGVRSEEKEFDVVIHNPWYFTPFARFIYLLLLVAIIIWYVREQKRRNQAKLRLQEHIHSEQLNEQKLHFFINISHEIRTPMTLILAPLLRLLKEDKDSHRHASYEIMKRNAERILHLINQILDIRKIDKGQMVMQMAETPILAFLTNVIELFEPQASTKRISITTQFPAEEVPLWIDRQQFDKVVINLLSNAIKFTPNGGRCEIKAAVDEPAKQLELRFFNSGSHIPEEDVSRIFERFYQTNIHDNSNLVGTGVGLDLASSIVDLHHGTIEACNVTDGVEFIIKMPLGNSHLKPEEIMPAEQVSEQASPLAELIEEPDKKDEADVLTDAPVSQGNSKRATVVIVEDDDEIRGYLENELSDTYRTVAYCDGAEALPNILREIPQVIISDLMMPKMDGITLCSKVKGNVNTNHVPFVMLTAKTRDDDKLQGLETGADLYVTKPFNMEILRRSIGNLLASRKIMENKFTGKEDQKEQIDNLELESIDERLLNRIMAVINANLNNSDLNIDMICTEVGISRVHLHRKMKELTNQTPHDFIRNLRLKQAARLLARGGQSITEVMYRCGFNSPTSFSTMFKKMYGVSPREYMKMQDN